MTNSTPVRAIVAGHGTFAEGMTSAVARITGLGEVLAAFSVANLGRDDIERELTTLLEATAAHVIFTDLPAGSATMAARKINRDRPDVFVVTGVNLAALLDFVCHGGTDAEALATIVEKGRGALTLVGGR